MIGSRLTVACPLEITVIFSKDCFTVDTRNSAHAHYDRPRARIEFSKSWPELISFCVIAIAWIKIKAGVIVLRLAQKFLSGTIESRNYLIFTMFTNRNKCCINVLRSDESD